jgi:hypothetical protein
MSIVKTEYTEEGRVESYTCDCGTKLEPYGGMDIDCTCGRMYNGFGQEVKYSLQSIDPLDAGEHWDE